jgi:hypothetical protein
MIYFAYGSNLDEAQMAIRCPDARFVGIAQLPNHRICFPRRSPIRNCAVASIERAIGETVWGVLYDLTLEDFERLDAREGFDPSRPEDTNRYNRTSIVVETLRGDWIQTETYVAMPEPDPGLPSIDYLSQIIYSAMRLGFPESYMAKLRDFPVDPDA